MAVCKRSICGMTFIAACCIHDSNELAMAIGLRNVFVVRQVRRDVRTGATTVLCQGDREIKAGGL